MGKFDIAEELLAPVAASEKSVGKFDIADELISGRPTPQPLPEVSPDVRPTGEISTVTGEEFKEIDPTAPDPPDFKTIAKASLVKDIETKKRIFAEARGIPVERYGVKDGEVVFLDDNGILRSEKSEQKGQGLKRFAAETAGDPATIVGAAGSVGGIPGVIAGTIAGETARQFVAGLILNDPQTPMENLTRLGAKGIEATISEIIGKFGIKALQKLLGKGQPKAKVLSEVLGDDFFKINIKKAQEIKKVGKEFGIDFNLAETTKNRHIIGMHKILRDLPESADTIEAADFIRSRQLQSMVPGFLKELGLDKTPGVVGKEVSTATKTAIRGLKADRSKITSPIYKRAFAENKTVDIEPVINFIDEQLSFAKGDVRKALLSLKNDFLKPDLPKTKVVKGRPESKILSPDGRPAIPATADISLPPEFDTSLQGLHGLKLAIQKKIDKPGQESVDRFIKSDLIKVKQMLVTQMEDQSKLYKTARLTHALLSSSKTELGRKLIASEGLMSTISKAKEKDLINVSQLIMSSKQSNPDTVGHIKNLIMQQPNGENIWDSTVKNFIIHKFENIKDVRKPTRLGFMLEQSLFANKSQRDIMKVALGDKFNTFKNFFEVLKRTGLSAGEISEGSIKQGAKTKIKERFLNKLVTAMVSPLRTPERVTNDFIQNVRLGKGVELLSDLLTDPTATKQIEKLMRLRPKSQKLIKGVANFLTLSGQRELEDLGTSQLRINQNIAP